ncbi:MAG TPA: hypothetical protein VJM32_01975 [Candidatus Saccharimonadales bacterium]|nr:hypothetical protein [Candidatus Saccharimonadales bacterium]
MSITNGRVFADPYEHVRGTPNDPALEHDGTRIADSPEEQPAVVATATESRPTNGGRRRGRHRRS